MRIRLYFSWSVIICRCFLQDENLTEFEWALFGGNWGAPLVLPKTTLWCFDNEDQTSLSKCETNTTTIKAILLASKLLGVVGLIDDQEGDVDLTDRSSLSQRYVSQKGTYQNSFSLLDSTSSMESRKIDKVLLGGPYHTKAPSNTSIVQYPSIPGIMTRGFSYLWVS